MAIDERTFKSVLFVAFFLSAAPLMAVEPVGTAADEDRATLDKFLKRKPEPPEPP